MTPLIAGDLMQYYKSGEHDKHKKQIQLTQRQREVLQLLVEGHSAMEIASVLQISPRTVEFHKYRMMEDLGMKTVADLIKYAINNNIVA